jgi:hypothetical protein
MTNDDIVYLRLLADWHDRQADYLLLTVPAGQHDQGRFHFKAAARLSRLADEATMGMASGPTSTWRATVRPSFATPASSDSKASSRSAEISIYRSGRSPDWLKMKNADAPAVKREEEEEWGKKKR